DRGRAGWTWYTGSAGWFRRTVIEELLGIRMRCGTVFAAPALPAGWDGFTCRFAARGAEIEVVCRRTGKRTTAAVRPEAGRKHVLEVTV
ncbi:MAG: hypothetical protein IJL69_01060, partial [Oscillospiraceae bacterium]|nr:hypothetical protein [Oscillospiraceae bacterium]